MTEKQTKKNWSQFIFARQLSELDCSTQKILFFLWNATALLLSSAALCAVSLNFAIGKYDNLFYIFLGYLRTSEIFLLNWLPVLFLQLLLYSIMNTQWIAFLITGAVAMSMSIGNYFKLIFRSDPFTFSDLTSIKAGLSVAGDYNIQIDERILLSILFVVVATLILGAFARGKLRIWKRLLILAVVPLTIWWLWEHFYSDTDRYNNNAYQNFLFVTRDSRDYFIANGFYYPFIYSITQSSTVPPEEYNEEKAVGHYSEYHNEVIPSDKKVNLLVIQLESFTDLEEAGFGGVSGEVYAPLRQLQNESYSGIMVASVIGGGTVVTERDYLTGSYLAQDFFHPAYSYVRYLNSQGYRTIVSHPNASSFYARGIINEYLGFNKAYYLDNYYQELTDGERRCDRIYIPEVFRLFREEIKNNVPVFSFNVSLQGHSPYNTDDYDRENWLWIENNVSDSTRHVLNNYLSQIKETQELLLQEMEKLSNLPEPIVCLVYGDHKPLFSDEIYQELGIVNTMETEQSMAAYLGTPYLIWANPAAKKVLGNDFLGKGSITSPGFLMNILFEQLDWAGPAFLQYTDEVMQHISVICTRGGYVEDGRYVQTLSESGELVLKEYRDLLYYLHYRPEQAE